MIFKIKKKKAFTLVEQAVVLVITAIIMFGVGYVKSISNVRVEQANSTIYLSKSMPLLASYFYENKRSYINACTYLNLNITLPPKTTIQCNASESGYTLNIVGQNFTYGVDEKNTRWTSVAPAGWNTNNSCWIKEKGGSCI